MNQQALWVQFDKHRFALGMEWRLLESDEKVSRAMLHRLGREGAHFFGTCGVQSFVGLCGQIAQLRHPVHSAALHLATHWSTGGLELFVFGMPEQQVALLALNAQRPMPGFDFIGTLAEVQALIEEFEAIEQGQLIRRIGDTGLLANEEHLSAQTVFDQPTDDSKLKKIPSLKNFLTWVGAATIVLAGVLAGVSYLQNKELKELINKSPTSGRFDPNLGYNRSALEQLQTLRNQGQSLYRSWIQIAVDLPLDHQGWALTQLECKAMQCTAQWRRQYGSVDDFYAAALSYTDKTLQIADTKDALTQSLHTQHAPRVIPAAPIYENLADLPVLTAGFRSVSSWLQDLCLVGARSVQVEKAQIWNAPSSGAALQQPMLKGTWSVELPLGLAQDLEIPPFANVLAFKTTLAATYELSGEYYARADSP